MYFHSINLVFEYVKNSGNAILIESNAELMDKVIWMNDHWSSVLRDKIKSEIKALNYKKNNTTPPNPAVESFSCNECRVVIVFPCN